VQLPARSWANNQNVHDWVMSDGEPVAVALCAKSPVWLRCKPLPRGDDYTGQASPPAFLLPGGVGGAKAIAAAGSMSFALLNNGSVAYWGVPAPELEDMAPIADINGANRKHARAAVGPCAHSF
jgi:hypothetical protein